ncbi:MAG: DSD1 family PLP-dependent enzyme [Acidobacteriia bacterium]|nr:DSD1 family PLP-dependent enzyme [Terriglobia bacterium]
MIGSLDSLYTPALLLDADIFEANLAKMHDGVALAARRIRPHAKAHKCPEIARRQMASGACGICVATLGELELMLAAGIEDILLCSPIASPSKARAIAALAADHPEIKVVVDHLDQARLYQQSAWEKGITLQVLVDLDTGDHRTGVVCGAPAVRLAEAVDGMSHLRFSGLQAFSGSAAHTEGLDGRRDRSRSVLGAAVETKQELLRKGMNAENLTGGSTGTWNIDTGIDGFTELQAGSYVFMDGMYSRIGGVEFGHALTVLATVVSSNHAGRCTVDAGFKAFSTDRPFGPDAIGIEGARWQWAGDEFGFVFADQLPALGERIRFIPPHCDPTVNLYDRIHVCRNGEVVATWPLKRVA